MLRTALFLMVATLALPATAQTIRQLGPHIHGVSTLDIAVDGMNVDMELLAPGDDIVGFETPATTNLRFFALFPNTQVVGAQLLTGRGQQRFVVARGQRHLDLGGAA